MKAGRRRNADCIDPPQQLVVVRESRNAELGPQPLARLGRGIGDADQFAVGEAGIFLCVKPAEVSGANDGAAQSRHAVSSIAVGKQLAPAWPRGETLAMAWHDPVRKWYAGLTPAWRRELRIGGLWLAFGLVAMPFLIYLAGVLTLGPYEGGLLAFLGSLLAAFFTLKLTAWLLVLGPYLLFSALRLLTRPLRRVG
jgi:hypothetical protein